MRELHGFEIRVSLPFILTVRPGNFLSHRGCLPLALHAPHLRRDVTVSAAVLSVQATIRDIYRSSELPTGPMS